MSGPTLFIELLRMWSPDYNVHIPIARIAAARQAVVVISAGDIPVFHMSDVIYM